jgi:hypothetical protein
MSDTAEAPDVTVDATAAIGAEEVEAPSWQEEAGVLGDPTAEKYETVGDLFKAYKEASSMIGSSIRFPTDEAGEEDIASFNNKMAERGYYRAPDQDDAENTRNIQRMLGLPNEPTGYQFNEVDGYEGDAESEGAFRALSHELGLTQAQAAGVHNWLASNIADSSGEMMQSNEEAMRSLQGEWGQTFNMKMQQARNAAHMLEERIPGISSYFDDQALEGNDVNMIRLMDAFAEAMGETGAMLPPAGYEGMSPQEAQQRIDEAQQNPDHWWHLDPDQLTDRQRDQRVEWLKAAYGG